MAGSALGLSVGSSPISLPISTPEPTAFAKLSDLVRKTDAFEVDQQEGRNMRIRVKPGRKSGTRKRKS